MARWALLSEADGGARTLALERVVRTARSEGLVVAGFVQRSGRDALGAKVHEVERLPTGERVRLSRPAARSLQAGELAYCDRVFRADGFAAARAWVEQDGPAADLLVLDVLSKLEAARQGHAATARVALGLVQGPLVLLSVHPSQLPSILEVLELHDEPVATLEPAASEAQVDGFVRRLVTAAHRAC